MFGDKILLGQKEISRDSKNRIVIPIETGREPNEELVCIYDHDLDTYEIYSIRTIKEKMDQLRYKILQSKTKQEEINYKKELYEFWKSILRVEKVNLQGRISIGDIFEGQRKMLSIGAYDHLIIESIKKGK